MGKAFQRQWQLIGRTKANAFLLCYLANGFLIGGVNQALLNAHFAHDHPAAQEYERAILLLSIPLFAGWNLLALFRISSVTHRAIQERDGFSQSVLALLVICTSAVLHINIPFLA